MDRKDKFSGDSKKKLGRNRRIRRRSIESLLPKERSNSCGKCRYYEKIKPVYGLCTKFAKDVTIFWRCKDWKKIIPKHIEKWEDKIGE